MMRWDNFFIFLAVLRSRNFGSGTVIPASARSPRSWSPPSSSSSAATTTRWDFYYFFFSSVAEPKFRLRSRNSCFSKVTKIMVTAIKFFLGSDNDEVGFFLYFLAVLRNRNSCFSKVTKIMVTAIKFFLGSDNDEVGSHFFSSVAEPKFRLRSRNFCFSKVTQIMVRSPPSSFS
jgi:hypothetical protein